MVRGLREDATLLLLVAGFGVTSPGRGLRCYFWTEIIRCSVYDEWIIQQWLEQGAMYLNKAAPHNCADSSYSSVPTVVDHHIHGIWVGLISSCSLPHSTTPPGTVLLQKFVHIRAEPWSPMLI